MITIALMLEWVNLTEPFYREIWFKGQKFLYIAACFILSAKMTQCRNEGLIPIDEFGSSFGDAAAKNCCLLVVTLDQVGNRIWIIEQRWIRFNWSQVAMSLEPLQSDIGLPNIAVCQGTK